MSNSNKVYVSYAWQVEEQNQIVDKLELACKERGLTLLRDKEELTYKGSIRQYMQELADGDAIILILSEAYFKSKYCMYEICEAHKRKDFRNSIFPVVVRDTPLYDEVDRIEYLAYWEDKRDALETKLSTVSRQYTANLTVALDEYADYRRLLDKLLAVLADMNSLTENVHIDTDFEVLLNLIQPLQLKQDSNKPKRKRQSDQQFRQKITENIRNILEQQTNLCDALKAIIKENNAEVGDLAEFLCKMDFEAAIDDYLYSATDVCLSELDSNSTSYTKTWEAAKTLLGWLSLWVVRDEWIADQEQLINTDDLSFTVQVATATGIEVASARFRQLQPKLAIEGKAEPAGLGGILPPQLNSGWGKKMPLQRILVEIWNKVFPEDTRQPGIKNLSKIELGNLDYALAKREQRKTHHYYIPIDRDQKIATEILKYLPSMTVIYLSSSATEPTLRVENEGRFTSIIREFLTMNDNKGT